MVYIRMYSLACPACLVKQGVAEDNEWTLPLHSRMHNQDVDLRLLLLVLPLELAPLGTGPLAAAAGAFKLQV